MFIRLINGVMNVAVFFIGLVIVLFLVGKQNAIALLAIMFLLATIVFGIKGEVGSALVSCLVSMFLYSLVTKGK